MNTYTYPGTDMDPDRIIQAMADAQAARDEVASRGHKPPSLDALFIVAMLAGAQATRKAPRMAAGDEPPAWFIDGLKHPDITSRHHTAKQLLASMGHHTPTLSECRAAGVWLAQMHYKRRRTNGRVVFFIDSR